MRAITNEDLWSAYRGLGMGRKTKEELNALILGHANSTAFASKVIVEAAKHRLAILKQRGEA